MKITWVLAAFAVFLHCDTSIGQGNSVVDTSQSLQTDEIWLRMHHASKLSFQSATAGYVVRTTKLVTQSDIDAKLAHMRQALQKTMEIRITNDRAFGREPDMQAYQARLEKNLADYQSKLDTSSVSTEAVRYFVSGQQYRLEKTKLGNEQNLDNIASAITQASLNLASPIVLIWTGTEFAEVYPPSDNSEGTSAIGFDERQGARPDFMYLGRTAGTDSGKMESVEPNNATEILLGDGQVGILLTVGSREANGIYCEFVVLPQKGYVTHRSVVYSDGVLMFKSKYSGYFEAGLGYFLPAKVERLNFETDDDGKTILHSSLEMVAFEEPVLNAEIPAELFDIERWAVGHHKLTHLLPQRSPYVSPQTDGQSGKALALESSGAPPRAVLLWLNVVFAILIALYVWWRRRQSGIR